MEVLLYCCCGLDVHKDLIEACILRGEGLEPETIRERFGTTRPELKRLTMWLSKNDCYSVAMESTGVYWKPIFETLELCSEYLEKIWVVNANHMRNLPGRKSDVGDAEWIATLLRHGLLEKSFVPPAAIRFSLGYAHLKSLVLDLNPIHRCQFLELRCKINTFFRNNKTF